MIFYKRAKEKRFWKFIHAVNAMYAEVSKRTINISLVSLIVLMLIVS